MGPFTTLGAACPSPAMGAAPETTSVPASSPSEPTLPRTIPSTRSPPLKITLPSMRVVAPIRLSMRFCGLLVLLNISLFPSCLFLEAHRVGDARLGRPSLINAHLHTLYLGFGIHPERAFHPPEVLESQPKGGRPGIRRLRKAHHNIASSFLQADHQLEPAVEVALAPRGRREEQQAVAIFAGQDLGLDLEAVDGKRVAGARIGGEHALESGEFLAHARVFLLERRDRLG